MKNWVNGTMLLVLLACGSLAAQPVWELNGWVGASGYLGDLEQEDYLPSSLDMIKPSFGLRAGYSLGYRWLLRADLCVGTLEGNDANSKIPGFQQRAFAFETHFVDLSANLLWEPFAKRRYPSTGGSRRIISPYVFAGLGMARFNTDTYFGKMGGETPVPTPVSKDKEAGPVHTELVVPLGGGLRFDVSKRSSIGLELSLRNPFSDYIDGISQAGNPNNNDWYMMGGLSWSLRFSRPDYDHDGVIDAEDKCPKVAGIAASQGCPDADSDGIEDLEDMCPFQAGDRALGGCPDRDNDTVADLLDKCPDVSGSAATEGCPDTDADGVRDTDDQCPAVAGKAALAGCPDGDGDGITDAQDECPLAPGKAEFKGCPFPDKDKDGVADDKDQCPDIAGDTKLEGCPDTDADGIADITDLCPDTAGVSAYKGCPELPATVLEQLKLAAQNVQFETGKAVLKPASLQELAKVTDILKEYTYFHLRISGHTDSQGNDATNQVLSEKRAKACLDQLGATGIDPKRMVYVGYGETQPIAPNTTPEGRRQNRRVHFELFIP